MARRAKVDEIDAKIIETLLRDSRTPFSRIARDLGLSDVAVLKRVRKLERLGVIEGYTVRVDPRKLGYEVVSITGIDVEPERLVGVLEELKSIDCVKYLAMTSGDHAIIAIIWARDFEELSSITKKISELPGVKRVCPAVVTGIYKA
ncbi:MAG: Lrp/AsnC family transcriptional regulator [Fervidicoccaceae archaeon]